MNEIFKSFTGGDSLATLDDIAQQLGVSKATVSKALNGAKDVSKKMQQAVVEKAVELGYSRLNYSTAAPRIAVFIINMDYKNPDDFGYDIIVGFRKAAEPAGFIVNVIPSIFGIITSIIIRCSGWLLTMFSASTPSKALNTVYPSLRK